MGWGQIFFYEFFGKIAYRLPFDSTSGFRTAIEKCEGTFMIDASRVAGSGIESNPCVCGASIVVLKENKESNLVIGSFRQRACPWVSLCLLAQARRSKFTDQIEDTYLAEE